MPTLKTQYEEFCQAYVRSPNAGEAAQEAGYTFEHRYQQGYRLLQRADISQRIAELRAAVAERECVRVEALLTKLETSYRQALKDRNSTAAVRVIELQAKLAGLIGGRAPLRPAMLDGASPAAACDDADGYSDDAVDEDDGRADVLAPPPAGLLPSPTICPSDGSSIGPSIEATRAALASAARSAARKRQRASGR